MRDLAAVQPVVGSFQQQSLMPIRKVALGGLAGAISTIAVWVLNTYGLLPGAAQIPPEVASALTALVAFIVSYFSSPGASDQVVRKAAD